MRRFIAAGLVAAAIVGTSFADDKTKEDKAEKAAAKTPSEQVDAIEKELRAEIGKVKSFEDRQKLLSEKAGKFLDIAKKNPTDEGAMKALVWVFRVDQGDAAKEATAIIEKDHLKSEKIVSIVPMLRDEKLLAKILNENPKKDVQGQACYALGQFHANKSEEAEEGNAAEAKEQQKKAEGYYDQVVAKFADVKMGRSTLGEQAKGELYGIRSLAVGMPAPEAESKDLEGKTVKLSDLKGKVVVVDIWATWCGPCRQMIPHEREMVKKLENKPFAFVSVSFDDEVDTLKKFIEKEPMPWTHWFNGSDGPLSKVFNVKHFPTIYVIDAKGVIRFKEVRGEKLDKAVETLLAEVK